MQPQKTYGLITRQNQAVKCQKCYSYFGYQNRFDFYICCLPFKLSKIRCEYHRTSCECEQCNSTEAKIDVNLSVLDELFLKKIPFQQNTLTQNDQISMSISGSQNVCCLCKRQFEYQHNTYLHIKCQKRCCHVCLYMIFSLQLSLFHQEDQILKSKYKLVMKCCDQEGEPIANFETFFAKNLCVFCGCFAGYGQSVIKLKSSFMFCLHCYYEEWNKEGKNRQFVWELIDLITEMLPKNCLYCERQIKLASGMSSYQIEAFNKQLCMGCHPIKSRTLDQVFTFLKKQIPAFAENSQYQCSQCGQYIERIKKKHQHSNTYFFVAEFKLIRWRDGKHYCGGCLYFKYQKLSRQFQAKKQKKNLFSSDINAFQAIKQSYQNHFMNRCMICSLPEPYDQKFVEVKKEEGKYKKKLSCKYCNKCYGHLQKDVKKFKQLINIKDQIHKRESYEPQSQNEKAQKIIAEASISEYFTGLFSKGSAHMAIEFQQSTKQMKQIILLERGNDQYQSARQDEEEEIFEEIGQSQQSNQYSQAVSKARIRQGKVKETPIQQNDKKNQQIDEPEWGKLEEFEYLEEINNKKVNSGMENTVIDYSNQIALSLINSGLIKQVQSISFQESSQPLKHSLPRQKCKVFSCSNLTSVIKQGQRGSSYNDKFAVSSNNRSNIFQEESNDRPLMMGLMCSSCFVKYLLGVIKKEAIDEKDWDKAIKERKQFTEKINKIKN